MEAWLQNLCKSPVSKSELHRDRPALGLMAVPQPVELFFDCQMIMTILTKLGGGVGEGGIKENLSNSKKQKLKKNTAPSHSSFK